MTKSDFIKLCNILLTSRYGLCLQELYLSENKVTQYERFHPFYPPSTGSFTISTSLKNKETKQTRKEELNKPAWFKFCQKGQEITWYENGNVHKTFGNKKMYPLHTNSPTRASALE